MRFLGHNSRDGKKWYGYGKDKVLVTPRKNRPPVSNKASNFRKRCYSESSPARGQRKMIRLIHEKRRTSDHMAKEAPGNEREHHFKSTQHSKFRSSVWQSLKYEAISLGIKISPIEKGHRGIEGNEKLLRKLINERRAKKQEEKREKECKSEA